MRLAIDGYEANASNRVGIGRYAFELLRHMEANNDLFSSVDVYVPEPVNQHMPKQTNIWKYHVLRPKPFWTFIGLPIGLLRNKPDVVFSPTHYVPRFISVPRVMAIMDVSYLKYPELFRKGDLHKLINWTSYSVRHAAMIITISQFSKRAIIDAYHVPAERVVVAYPSLPISVHTMNANKAERVLPARYILSVGTLQPRKNFTRLIEAFSRLKDKSISLVIVGKRGWLYDEIIAAPAKFGILDRVHFLEFVPDSELPTIYSQAECFVLPSLYEGFGLPVLEAMSFGVPVVVSKTSSLPEIAGKAGHYVDETDVESITAGIARALGEKGKLRKDRIELGKHIAKTFSWDKTAKLVMEVLSEVGRRKSI